MIHLKINKVRLSVLMMMVSTVLSAQTISHTFDDNIVEWTVRNGKVEIVEQGSYKDKSMRLQPGTQVYFDLKLQPSSTYRLTAWMRTESGADDFTMQINNLGRNNISVTTALATWTKIETLFNVSAGQETGELEFIFVNSQGNTSAWVDEISIVRTGDYREIVYTGIPPAPKRVIRSNLGIEMQPDEKMQWMLDDKLGMFIHWGIYAGPGRGEWYMENNGISPEEYRKLAYPESGDLYFTAKEYDSKKWVELAKKSGMRYINLTAMHHDGYALFESKYMNAFTSKNTHNRDFIKEYVEACREGGIKVGLFKTLINWRFPGYYDVTGTDCKPNKFGYTTNPAHKENARLLKEELYCQVKELMTKYGKIDQLFWDGGWLGQRGSDAGGAFFWESGKYMSEDNEWPVNHYFQDIDEDSGKPLGLMGMVRKYQPDILVNPRSGWIGDYTCEEGGGAVRGEIRSGVVEKCVSIAPGWGYNIAMEDPGRIMSLKAIKRLFADCMVRNMCFLLNVGPDRHGNIAPFVEKRLLEFGEWVHATSEAIYGTRGGPWQPVEGQYGFCYKENMIYIYFLGDFSSDSFTMPPVNEDMKGIKAYNVYTKEKVEITQNGQYITLKGIKPVQGDLTVIAIELNKNVRGE